MLRGTTHIRQPEADALSKAETFHALTQPYGCTYSKNSAHQLGSDPTEKVPIAFFHQANTLCKSSFFGVLRHRFYYI